jgi:hypothetical protein
LQLLFAAQAADGFLIRIDGDSAGSLDGWFHTFLESRNSGAAGSRLAFQFEWNESTTPVAPVAPFTSGLNAKSNGSKNQLPA